jgi:hypothetical protein
MHASIGESDADRHVTLVRERGNNGPGWRADISDLHNERPAFSHAHLDQHCRKIDQAGTLNKLKK